MWVVCGITVSIPGSEGRSQALVQSSAWLPGCGETGPWEGDQAGATDSELSLRVEGGAGSIFLGGCNPWNQSPTPPFPGQERQAVGKGETWAGNTKTTNKH